jgi:hypothetical protein
MSRARNLADLLDANGDVASGALDNVPASNDASALTTGTLPIARIADGDITAAKLSDTYLTGIADGTVTAAKLASTLDLSGKTVTLPSGTGGKVLQVVTNYPTAAAGYTSNAGSYTEISTAYRTTITPLSSTSRLILQWTGLVGGNATGAISTMKFYDVTNSADVGLSGISSGSRGIGHGSFRQNDSDGNDRDNFTMYAVVPSSNTTARTYGIFHYTESSVTKYFNHTVTNNYGCSYVKWHFTITEVEA